MKIKGKSYTTIWLNENDESCVQIIDQRWLPHEVRFADLKTVDDAFTAIKDMWVRGAPLIGGAAAYGMYLASLHFKDNHSVVEQLTEAGNYLNTARPTAVNLAWAVNEQLKAVKQAALLENISLANTQKILKTNAQKICADDIKISESIGENGLAIIEAIYQQKKETVNILTHCNAGWFATIDWGTATAPIYKAHKKGIPIHVWVDETRPRNQGARITAFELEEEGIDYSVIVDNVGGHLMQNKQVDLCIVGTDRTTYCGDVANKIGTYLKALAAWDNNIPFYVALPSTTIDWEIREGKDIPIELRSNEEVKYIYGKTEKGELEKILLTPENANAANYAFDVTPAKYITGLITEKGICEANEKSILSLFPEKALIV